MGCLTAHVVMLTQHRPITFSERRLADIALAGTAIFLAAGGMLHIHVINMGRLNEYVRGLDLNFLFAPGLASLCSM